MGRTLIRNGIIALVAAGIMATDATAPHGPRPFPVAFLLALWPTLGGHFVEAWFLDVVRPRLPEQRAIQAAARVLTWFVGGLILGLGISITGVVLTGTDPLPRWWLAGAGFIVLELVVHLIMQVRGLPNFYDGRG